MSLHKFSIVMVPDYLIKTFEASNITLEVLDKAFSNYEVVKLRDNTNEYIDRLFKEKVSKNDIIDLLMANRLLNSHLLPEVVGEPLEVKSNTGEVLKQPDFNGLAGFIKNDLSFYMGITYDMYKYESEFISLYMNNKININTIIMNEDNDSYKQLFELKVTDNTVYVILHSGFTNFIPYSVYEFKSYFLKKLMNCVVNAFGEETVFNSGFFKSYLRK